MQETVFIYTLSDPNTGLVRYVGKTDNLKRRYNEHFKNARLCKTHVQCWIHGLRNKGERPEMDCIDTVLMGEFKFWEQYYISLYKSWGFDLTNLTIGGDGEKMLQIVKDKISAKAKLRIRTPEHIKNLCIAQRARYDNGGTTWNKGKKLNGCHRLLLMVSHLGQPSAMKGKKGWANGKKQSAETIEKRVSKLRGRTKSEAQKKVTSETTKLAMANLSRESIARMRSPRTKTTSK